MTKLKQITALIAAFSMIHVASAQDDVELEGASPVDQTVPVADEPTLPEADPDTSAEADEVSEEKLLEEFQRYRLLLSEGTLDEADIAAKRIVEMAIKVYGPRSRETASALNNLGIVQHSNGQYDAAIQNFESAIDIVESVEDKLNLGLINPLKGLGAAQMANGRPDRAKATYDRATHITHVNHGPHNIEQTEILQSIAEAQLRLGDTKKARQTLDRIHILNVRFFEKDPLGLVPSLMSRATWQHRAGYYNEERTTYRRAIRIIEAGKGKHDPMLIEPLRRLAESYYFVDMNQNAQVTIGLSSTGEIYFKRAARIAAATDSIGWREKVRTQLALADYYTYADSQNRSRRIYRDVWQQLSTDEEKLALREELFGKPNVTRGAQLPTYASSGESKPGTPSSIRTGRIVVNYTVSTRGRVRDITTSANPGEFTAIQRMVHREIRQRVFRPMIVDGAPVAAEDQVFEHLFAYTQADLDELKRQQAAAEAQKRGRR